MPSRGSPSRMPAPLAGLLLLSLAFALATLLIGARVPAPGLSGPDGVASSRVPSPGAAKAKVGRFGVEGWEDAIAELDAVHGLRTCEAGLAVYNSPAAADANGSCLFHRHAFPARVAPRPDVLAPRLPWFSPTGELFFSCAAYAHFFKLTHLSNPIHDGLRDDLDKQCHSGRLNLTQYVGNVAALRGLAPAKINHDLVHWLAGEASGRAWMQAIGRAFALSSPFASTHEFYLERDQIDWSNRLPSEAAGRALGDVNTFEVRLPERFVDILFSKDSFVDARGRVTAVDLRARRFEVYYPQIAPWSFKPLMLDPIGPYRKNIEFAVNNAQRNQYLEQVSRNPGTDCLDAAKRLSKEKRFNETVKCSQGVAVARLYVISQHLSREMFHFLCESLPRLAAVVPGLRSDPTVYIHATDCKAKIGYCASFLQALGIASSRLLDGTVYAAQVMAPAGGRGHWPLSSLWGIESLARLVDVAPVLKPASFDCSAARVMIIKRKSTRLQPFSSSSYDRWAVELKRVFPWITVRFFDDTDSALMRSMPGQIEALRWADVLVGAHGAAMSWIPFLKPCAHVVSLRGRSNSDIYEHLALGFGIGFHHAHFRYQYDDYIDEIITGVGDALVYQHSAVKPKPPVIMALTEGFIAHLPFAEQRPRGCNVFYGDDKDRTQATHFALVRAGISVVSPGLVGAFEQELWELGVVAIFLPKEATSAIVFVRESLMKRMKQTQLCSLSEKELAERFESVMVVRELGKGVMCEGIARPYRGLDPNRPVAVQGAHVRIWNGSLWSARPLPRDMCQREAPDKLNLGAGGPSWRAKEFVVA